MSTASIKRGIVAGIDGSDSALGAAQWAASIAHLLHEPLYLTHIVPDGAVDADSDAALTTAADAVHAARPDVAVERTVGSGRTADALMQRSESARVLVLGHTTTTEWESMITRSDVVHTANHAPCPVATWRGEPAPAAVDDRPVVVGVDGTDLSSKAVEHAFEFADLAGAPLVAVHTWKEHSTLTYGEASRFSDWSAFREHRTAMLAENLAGLSEQYPDVEVTYSVERGKPDVVLLEQSANAQLVVVGSHGRGALASAVVGSTSQGLIHHAKCPVLICRN